MLSDIAVESGRSFYSQFQEAVASKLRAFGYQIDEEIESGGRFIDLAVVDPAAPGRYVLGIEYDGASYHSSRTTRERDRIREDHLRDLGWNFHRIWSTDWFRNPDRELERARVAIDRALNATNEEPKSKRTTTDSVTRRATNNRPKIPRPKFYESATVNRTNRYLDIDSESNSFFIQNIQRIVRIESPVHVDVVKRRIVESFDEWLTRKLSARLEQYIEIAVNSRQIDRCGDFLWRHGSRSAKPRDRSELPTSKRKIEYVAPEELMAAIEMVVRQAHGIKSNEAIAETVRLLGFKRVTNSINEHIGKSLTAMIDSGQVSKHNGHLVIQD